MENFDNKIVLVTGATAGIGLACAKEFSRSKARVILVGRDPEKGRKAIAEHLPADANCEFIAADIRRV